MLVRIIIEGIGLCMILFIVCADASGMKLELYEVRKGLRLHCVVRKSACASDTEG